MTAVRVVSADRGDQGVRLDLVLRRHLNDLPSATRTRVQFWIEEGQVTINGTPAFRAAGRVMAGDEIAVTLPLSHVRRVMEAEDLPLHLLHEDEHLLVIDKPPGVVVHPTYRHSTGTVMNALLWHARSWPSTARPSIVGRLDKLTSGLVVVAKTRAVHAALQRILASTRSEKDYLAVVYGRVSAAEGVIRCRLSRDTKDRRRVVASENEGVASETLFERLDSVPAPGVGLSLIRCRLRTGRMHQIRVHLASQGWPIVGDPVYGMPLWRDVADAPLSAELRAFPRQALHAWRVTLTHPGTLERLVVHCPLPPDITALISASELSHVTLATPA